ncbi:MAG: hypothetical protein KDA17_01960 [Candidatus Saccharibacteria bacterium]|nr:hypothetical protein [Candidatus Saccharibacteria bacterium]
MSRFKGKDPLYKVRFEKSRDLRVPSDKVKNWYEAILYAAGIKLRQGYLDNIERVEDSKGNMITGPCQVAILPQPMAALPRPTRLLLGINIINNYQLAPELIINGKRVYMGAPGDREVSDEDAEALETIGWVFISGRWMFE